MSDTVITVTEAARNFSECVNQAHYQNQTFLLLKNGAPVARLEPAGDKTCSGRDLAAVVASAELSADDAKAWSRDLKAARAKLKTPKDKWR